MKNSHPTIILCLCLVLAGCKPASSSPVAPEAASLPTEAPVTLPTNTLPPPAAEPTRPAPTGIPTDAAGMPVAVSEALPIEPQRVEFESVDGARLVGMYYPAAANPAPLVVLMHWAGGDRNDWVYLGMAAWLQNRGLEIPAPPLGYPFDTPYPFPPLPEGISFGVFLFDFRGFGESAPANLPFEAMAPLWVGDARAAYQTARSLPGVDPERMVGIGASIGADGVVDACGEGCLGALSLSPGNYLEVPYSVAVTILDQDGKTAWCVAAEDDPEAAATCRSATGEDYQTQVYPSGGHAMTLFQVVNELDPVIDSLILDFLEVVFNE